MNALDAYGGEVLRRAEEALSRERHTLEKAAALLADAIERGGLIYVTGTGHAHMLAEEPFYRAGGLAAIHPILVPALMLHEGAIRSTSLERLPGLAREILQDLDLGEADVLIVASNSGRNAFPVEAALVAHERGTPVIALTSIPHGSRVESRHPSRLRLLDVADLVLDTGSPYGDAAVPLGEGRPTVGPVSTILGALLLNAITARATQLLCERGADPDVFVSANSDGTGGMSAERLAYWRSRVRSL